MTMENFVDNRGNKTNNKHELCLFYSTVTSLQKILFAKQNIRTLIIIGQRDIHSFSAISELLQLQELWIVECGIKDVPSLKENCLLKKLYLYSNEISSIPNLEACPNLIVLYLSGNNIRKLENINTLTSLQELNVADNKLERINKMFGKKSELHSLNLAGNPLRFIRDIRYLSQMQKLNSLVFSDPLYGDCPFVTFCNYRMHVIHYLPHIKKLDHYKIDENERHWINHFFKKQVTNYNILIHKELNINLSLLKRKYKKYKEKIFHFKEQLYAIEMKKNDQNYLKHEVFNNSQKIMSKLKSMRKQLRELREMQIIQSKILQQKLLINMYYCGNVNFVEYNSASENTVMVLCKRFLQASLCPVTNILGITNIKLHKVTKVSNKEISQLHSLAGRRSQSSESSKILKILASPGVTDIQKWPFYFFQNGLFVEDEVSVTNCLVAADFYWLNKIRTSSSENNKNNVDLYNICENRRVCILLQAPIFNFSDKVSNVDDCLHEECANYNNNTNVNETEACQIFKLMNTDMRNPMFIIEYEYIFSESRMEESLEETMSPYTLKEPLHVSSCNLKEYANHKMEMCNLVKINISGQNVKSIDIDLNLPKLREIDISYNQLSEFPNRSLMKNVRILNISFNNIKLLCIEEELPSLEELDTSWNLLSNCLQTINIFTTFIPNMYKLKIYNNPFEDIIDPDDIDYFIQTYLPKLQFINNCKCENLCLPQNYFPCAFNMCKLNSKRRNKLIYLKYNTFKNVEQVKLLEKKNIEHSKYIHISQDFVVASNVSKKVKNLQEFCATCCLLSTYPFTKPLNNLIKLNLGNNYISLLDNFTQENLPSLKYLDLTNNLITSLEPMGSFYTLQEFYCGNNEIERTAQIDNVKTWQALRIIDLSENPLTEDTFYKKYLIFHLSNIEYVSGEYVQSFDVAEARCMFGNKCDKHVLSTIYQMSRLANITQLSLVDCSLSMVDLSAEYLPQLESLDLSKNQITYFWGLHSFKHLRTLCLSYNCLEIFSGDEYGKTKCIYPKLYTLLLDHNCIKSVTNITKQKLPVIKHVFLNHNHLQNFNEIIYCSTLESLILDYNEIEALNAEDFTENDNLKFLSLENNKIKSLEFTKSLKKLKKLYVAHNCIENEKEIQYLPLLKNLEEITFEGNPLYTESNGNKIMVNDFGVRDPETEEI